MTREFLVIIAVSTIYAVYIFYQKMQVDTSKRKSESRYLEGLSHVLNNKPERAVELFQELLDSGNDMVEVHIMLGNIFRGQGYFERALQMHQAILLRQDLSFHFKIIALYELAKDYFAAGMLDRAESVLQELLAKKAMSKDAMIMLLEVYEQSKQWHTAIKTAKQLQNTQKVNINSRLAHYYCELAHSSDLSPANFDRAKENLLTALTYDPDCLRALIALAEIYTANAKYEDALLVYKNMLDNDCQYIAEVIPSIAKCYLKLGKSDQVFDFLGAALDKEASIIAILQYSEWLLKEKGVSATLTFILTALKKHPSIKGLGRALQLFNSKVGNEDLNQLIVVTEELAKNTYS